MKKTIIYLSVSAASSLITAVVTSFLLFDYFSPIRIEKPAVLSTGSNVVYFSNGGDVKGVRIRVISASGDLIEGATVAITTSSGDQFADTDADGIAFIELSDPSIQKIRIDDEKCFGEDYSGSSNSITIENNGINILIIKMNS